MSTLAETHVKIDFIVPVSAHDWEADSYAKAYAGIGHLNQVVHAEANDAEAVLEALERSKADGFIFLAGDQYLSFLHDTQEKSSRIQGLGRPTLCYYGEPIKNNPIPWMPPRAEAARAVYTHHAFAYEADSEFFKEEFKAGRAMLSPFAADPDLFTSTTPPSERKPIILFTGKTTDFGIKGSAVYERRRRLARRLVDRRLAHVTYRPELTWPQYVQLLNQHLAFIVLPGLNDLADGFSRKAFEVMAGGCLLLHPAQSPGSQSAGMLRDGEHCLYYNGEDEDGLEAFIHALAQRNGGDLVSIALAGRREVLDGHTLEHRALGLTRFCLGL